MSAATPPGSLVSHALRLIAARPHARGELVRKLTAVCMRRRMGKRAAVRAEYASVDCAATAAATVALLNSAGSVQLVDDVAYAEWHVAQRDTPHANRSRAHVVAELRVKGVSPAVIDSAIAPFDDVQACMRAIQRRRSRAKSQQHLLASLARAGFHARTIAAAEARLRGENAASHGSSDSQLQ